MKNQNQIQQGDVLLRRVTNSVDLSKGVKVKKNGNLLTLAEGEATGHHHSIMVEENEAELIQMGEKMLLNLKEEKVLTHQEHGPVTVGPGIWEVGQVVEKDWLSGMVKPVVD